MTRHRLLVASACLLSRFAMAQDVPAFMIGPTVGIDQVRYVNNGSEYVKSPYYTSSKRVNFGMEGYYQTHRLLFGVKALYTSRMYQASLSPVGTDWAYTTLQQANANLHVLTVPLSISYRLVSAAGFHWLVGGNVATEYLLGTSDQLSITSSGATMSSKLAKHTLGRSVNIGYGAQTILRYQLTPAVGLQLEPAFRYYPSGGFPTKVNDSYQYQGTFSVLFRV